MWSMVSRIFFTHNYPQFYPQFAHKKSLTKKSKHYVVNGVKDFFYPQLPTILPTICPQFYPQFAHKKSLTKKSKHYVVNGVKDFFYPQLPTILTTTIES